VSVYASNYLIVYAGSTARQRYWWNEVRVAEARALEGDATTAAMSSRPVNGEEINWACVNVEL